MTRLWLEETPGSGPRSELEAAEPGKPRGAKEKVRILEPTESAGRTNDKETITQWTNVAVKKKKNDATKPDAIIIKPAQGTTFPDILKR